MPARALACLPIRYQFDRRRNQRKWLLSLSRAKAKEGMQRRAVQFSSCEGCAIAMRVEGAVFGLKTSLPVIGKA